MGDNNTNVNENQGANNTSSNNNTNDTNLDYEKLYQKLDEIINDRNNRNSSSISKSFFSEQGLSEEQVSNEINAYKNFKKEEEARKTKEYEDLKTNYANLEKKYNETILNNEINLSLVQKGFNSDQINHISRMIDINGVLDDKSNINKEKLNENIESLFKTFPELLPKKEEKSFVQIGTSNNSSQYEESSDALLRKAFGLKENK